jgi:hypothetical protein
MKTKKQPVLYFTNGPVPTKDDAAAIALLEKTHRIVLRNGIAARSDYNAEPCEGVAGLVPEHYAGIKRVEVTKVKVESKL